MKVLIIAAHQQNRETYGTRRVKHELAAQGHDVGRDRIGWLRRELELRCKQRCKSVASTNPGTIFRWPIICWNSGSPTAASRSLGHGCHLLKWTHQSRHFAG